MQTSKTARKVKAASIGGGLGAAVAQVLIFLLEALWMEIPGSIETSLTLIITVLCAWAIGYQVPPAFRDKIIAD